jgi:hypothetical protein
MRRVDLQGQVVVFDLSIRSRHIWCCGEPFDGKEAENCSIVLLRNFALVADHRCRWPHVE